MSIEVISEKHYPIDISHWNNNQQNLYQGPFNHFFNEFDFMTDYYLPAFDSPEEESHRDTPADLQLIKVVNQNSQNSN